MRHASIHPRTLGYLGRALSLEHSAVQQYMTQAALCEAWGLHEAAARFREETVEEMQHANRIVSRMLGLGVSPNGTQLRPAALAHDLTDLLLHDMGPGLADNMGEGVAAGSEWRTAPLWNIGHTAGVNQSGEAYLHDGRARTLEEAILWHGGEGEASKEAFRNMSAADRAALIKFLESL